MNHDCNGNYYRVGLDRFYRCFLDGTVLKASEVGATCPRCRRTIAHAAQLDLVPVRRRLVTEVQLENGWTLHSEETR